MMNNENVLQLLEIITSVLKKYNISHDTTQIFQTYLDFFEASNIEELSDDRRIAVLKENIIMKTALSRKDFIKVTREILLNGKLVNIISNQDCFATLDKIFDVLLKIENNQSFDQEKPSNSKQDFRKKYNRQEYPLLRAY